MRLLESKANSFEMQYTSQASVSVTSEVFGCSRECIVPVKLVRECATVRTQFIDGRFEHDGHPTASNQLQRSLLTLTIASALSIGDYVSDIRYT